jgi:glyoxalase/bleomycin resistance protein/dioxygenase superfamily protein
VIRGMHGMIYSTEPEALRAFLRDKLELSGTDIGDGWMIFNPPESDLGVHPTDGKRPPSGAADISFYCDDIRSTVATLKERGVEFTAPVEDQRWGFVTRFTAPGNFQIMLYQPKYGK